MTGWTWPVNLWTVKVRSIKTTKQFERNKHFMCTEIKHVLLQLVKNQSKNKSVPFIFLLSIHLCVEYHRLISECHSWFIDCWKIFIYKPNFEKSGLSLHNMAFYLMLYIPDSHIKTPVKLPLGGSVTLVWRQVSTTTQNQKKDQNLQRKSIIRMKKWQKTCLIYSQICW